MNTLIQGRKICDSWYHQTWFRILLVVVGVDMFLLGTSLVIGLDILGFIQGIPGLLRIIGGLAYALVAIFIIHYAVSYRIMRKKTSLLCQHCAHIKPGEKEV